MLFDTPEYRMIQNRYPLVGSELKVFSQQIEAHAILTTAIVLWGASMKAFLYDTTHTHEASQ